MKTYSLMFLFLHYSSDFIYNVIHFSKTSLETGAVMGVFIRLD